MKNLSLLGLLLLLINCGRPSQSISDAARDYLSKSLYDPSSLIIDTIVPIDTLTVGESLAVRIDESDPSSSSIYISISFADSVPEEDRARILREREKRADDEMKLEHLELIKLRDSVADKLDSIISVTYEIKFRANDVKGVPVNYEQVFRVNSEGRVTEMAENVGNLRAWIDIIEYNRLKNKLYNTICRWDNCE